MKIIAHRGASGEFPENSLLAFEQAILQGCDGIEFDIQYHQPSGEFILLHDSYLNRTEESSDEEGFSKEKVHFNQLSLTDLTDMSTKGKYRLCTLADALQCINQQCLINIELKSATQGLPLADEMQKLEQLIQQLKLDGVIAYQQIIISSFNHHTLLHTKKYLSAVNTAALIVCCPVDYAEFCKKLKVNMLNLAIDFINPEIINDAHSKGLQVWVYTVDHPAQIKQCLQYQVDGIFTNFPARSREVMLALTGDK
ncbi:MAG: glycerophosphodiester phosphodiesterase [Cognaticolwellia sp.]